VDIKGWADWALALIAAWPDTTALVIGAGLSWAPGFILETWFLPPDWPDRRMKQVTLSVTVVVALLTSYVLWRSLDPADKWTTVAVVSSAAACAAPFIHIAVAATITHFLPWTDSVYAWNRKKLLENRTP
jgi:hypothetical protein